MTRRMPAVVVGSASASLEAGWHRVTAEVDGVPVWFEARDVALSPVPEAFASAFLLPVLHRGSPLAMAEPLDPVWASNARKLVEILNHWWGYPKLTPSAPSDGTPSGESVPRGDVALFFSAGVDSFYSLLRGGVSIGCLVTVQGFDIGLEDHPRMAAMERALRAVSAAHGLGTVIVRTNLREHPLVREVAWERAHGGALAAVGHVLGSRVSEALISSSITRYRDKAWGSHWMTDPLYSSSRVGFREIGMELRRVEKLPQIAADPLVREHLRVCWENRTALGNCSRCAKCLITRLTLAGCGALDAFPTLEGTASLARDLDALPAFHERLNALTELSESPHLDPDTRRAAVALLERSRHARSLPVRARRALLRKVLALAGGRRT